MPERGLFSVELRFPMSSGLVAFRVQGDGFYPRYRDKDVILVWADPVHNFSHLLGKDVLITLDDDSRELKTLRKGYTEGLYNLESGMGPVIEDASVRYVREIHAIIPGDQVVRFQAGLDQS